MMAMLKGEWIYAPAEELEASLRKVQAVSTADDVRTLFMGDTTAKDHPANTDPLIRTFRTELLVRACGSTSKKRAVIEQLFRQADEALAARILRFYGTCVDDLVRELNRRRTQRAEELAFAQEVQALQPEAEALGLQLRVDRQQLVISGDLSADVMAACLLRDKLAAVRADDGLRCDTFYPAQVLERLRWTLQQVAKGREGQRTLLHEALDRQDRASAERALDWIELRAERDGKAYVKGIARFNAVRGERFPDLKDRLDMALEKLKMSPNEREARRWLGFVEEAGEGGRVYAKGLEKLQALDLSALPELQQRLDAAMTRSAEVARDKVVDGRILVLTADLPFKGTPIQVPDEEQEGALQWAVVQYCGAPFDLSRKKASETAGFEGQAGEEACYAYWRLATPEEAQTFEDNNKTVERPRG